MLPKYKKGFTRRDRYLTIKICILMHKRSILIDSYSVNLPLFLEGLRFLENSRRGDSIQGFSITGEEGQGVSTDLLLVMYGFCGNNALHSISLSFTIFIFLLIPFDI